jgi:hypothetical protein
MTAIGKSVVRGLITLALWSYGGTLGGEEVLPAAQERTAEPIAIYLTWQRDPMTTMTVQWISTSDDIADSLHYRPTNNSRWLQAHGSHHLLAHQAAYHVHWVELTGLQPGTIYHFKLTENGKEHQFRTLANTLNGPIRFAVGGDIYHDGIDQVKKTNRQVAKLQPDFVLWGGDLAYSFRHWLRPENGHAWLELLSAWQETMIGPDGCMVPLIPVIGNHDVQGGYNQGPASAPFYYTLFAMPGLQGYNVLDFGNLMTILLLDSGHTHAVTGAQSLWLETSLAARKHVLNKFALYHVPAYPAVRSSDSKMSPEIRRHWVPLFEKYGLKASFENHDHTYKRTCPIKEGKCDPSGVLYLGDGAWGVLKPRSAKSSPQAWYLAFSKAASHFIMVIVEGGKSNFRAIDSDGEPFDAVER